MCSLEHGARSAVQTAGAALPSSSLEHEARSDVQTTGAALPSSSLKRALLPPAPAPLARFPGRVLYARTAEECDWAVDALTQSLNDTVRQQQQQRVLALDIEWRPPPATIQLVTASVAVVIQLSAIGGVTPRLRALLLHREVIKAGVGFCMDAVKLVRFFGAKGLRLGGVAPPAAEIRGLVCLGELAWLVKTEPKTEPAEPGTDQPPPPASTNSLAGLPARFLKEHLSKDKILRLGNWEANPLSDKQLSDKQYAHHLQHRAAQQMRLCGDSGDVCACAPACGEVTLGTPECSSNISFSIC
ncbi:ribonuclease H-like domain-containing protein [Pavlovales sp. CCMP2436]|nr:ribonuclease H-like domain-containing protein [Pavlovales sp. CCMP2436]